MHKLIENMLNNKPEAVETLLRLVIENELAKDGQVGTVTDSICASLARFAGVPVPNNTKKSVKRFLKDLGIDASWLKA